MALRQPGDRASYPADSDLGIDGQGYCLSPGDDGGDSVDLAVNDDPFVGVSFRSTKSIDDEEVFQGDPVAVEWDGWVNVLCSEGFNYNLGDPVYLSDTPGIADPQVDSNGDSTDDTQIGKVVRSRDLSGASEPGLVAVNISGRT